MRLPAKIFTSSALIFLSRIVGAAVMFGAQALIAKWLGAESLGQYLQAIAAANLCGGLFPLGYQTIAAYFAAEYSSLGKGHTLRAFMKQTYMQTIGMSVMVLLVGLFVLERFFPDNAAITFNWPQINLYATGIALAGISGNVLIAMKRPFLGMGVDTILRPLLIAASLGMIFIPVTHNFHIADMLWFAGISFLFAAFVYVLIARAAILKLPSTDALPEGERSRWWRYALPWTLIGLATDFFFDLDLLLLSNSLSYSDIAVFGVMTRLFSLASFGVSSVYLVSLPDVFAERAKNNNQSFNSSLVKANLAAMGIAVLMVAGIAVFGPFALSFFGPEFDKGTMPLVILSLALAMRCVFGPAALMLSLHDRPSAALPSVALGLVCLVVGNHLLVPTWGLHGAAWSALIAMAVWSGTMWYRTLRVTGTDISIFLPVWSLMKVRRAAGASGP
ncbi:lipopolysaccharide biosynthesis protein [Aestuariivirga litoralis]|uniref:lipopolysaccharide biosynthesis protein n=1 Tax=Aestuariivirga litoralis TaxID=2650924 RepID=UPI0018C52A0C|nr:polysaccharide biosynthesis C-terminal domain-containing protein [Aestuariivirga litoralis]MBG1232749.1 hypothetical protein [Aestuariivirga litoralis]